MPALTSTPTDSGAADAAASASRAARAAPSTALMFSAPRTAPVAVMTTPTSGLQGRDGCGQESRDDAGRRGDHQDLRARRYPLLLDLVVQDDEMTRRRRVPVLVDDSRGVGHRGAELTFSEGVHRGDRGGTELVVDDEVELLVGEGPTLRGQVVALGVGPQQESTL